MSAVSLSQAFPEQVESVTDTLRRATLVLVALLDTLTELRMELTRLARENNDAH